MTQVKVCGVCDVSAARAAAEAGADLIGFHFCSSRRRIRPEEAREIASTLGELGERRPLLVGVFIDQSEEEVDDVAGFVGLDMVQLHGSEAPGFRASRPVMKALKVRDGRLPETEAWPEPFLLDSWSPDQRGGTGRSWDWESARELARRRRLFFAGGLDPGNVGEVVRRYRPYGVDVSSGVDKAIRVKDPALVGAFVQAVREADEG
ncbi:phosphoribosylanthranilate isomerase [Candidatus Nephthysia bennettiae]|uniref:N-(5'-phosphoribosyl)anthranilate isomerase n=1 Tax=Candidatus Nephthysia bennettiae TaxID=3127016 RepID=A0A934K2W6_9BACT|nr:phosphoribosylanthranilate isomerase [Candidatus Dormibacteraeota bacterium]MBJ7611714.1 phosphoribosylanthranilate isomerase [Candidatus Dormibacteraeota bacterium]